MISNRKENERGAALAELAMVLGLLVLLTFGAMEYGWLFFRMQQVSEAARGGARAAIVEGSNNPFVTSTVNNLMNDYGFTGHSVSVSADVTATSLGQIITVYVEAPYAANDLLGLSFLPLPSQLRASASMAKEGPVP